MNTRKFSLVVSLVIIGSIALVITPVFLTKIGIIGAVLSQPQETPQQYALRTASAVQIAPPQEIDPIMVAMASPIQIGTSEFGMLAIRSTESDGFWAYSAIARMDAEIKEGTRVKVVQLWYQKRHNHDLDVSPDGPDKSTIVFIAEPARR